MGRVKLFYENQNDLRADDPELTPREIQVVIWSLIDNPPFDVDRISEYEEIDPRIYKDGKPLFDVQKVKDIVGQVKTRVASFKNSGSYLMSTSESGLTIIQNNGQTIIIDDETAYAVRTTTADGEMVVDSDHSICFDEEIISGISFNNWGWTNGPLSDPSGELTYDIYAGAAQCDLNRGTRVGKLTVNYSDGTLTVTYEMTETGFTGNLYTLTETHLYVGTDPYPTGKDSDYTVAPGQYGNSKSHADVTEYTYEIEGLSGNIYFIAHAVVSGFQSGS